MELNDETGILQAICIYMVAQVLILSFKYFYMLFMKLNKNVSHEDHFQFNISYWTLWFITMKFWKVEQAWLSLKTD